MDDLLSSDISDHMTPLEAAMESLAGDPVRPAATIRYISRGRLLVIGEQEPVEALIAKLPTNMDISVALADLCRPALREKISRRGMRLLDSLSEIDVSGWMGNFRLTATTNRGGPAFCESGFDLILDLLEPPIARRTNPPIGYFAASASPEKLEEALTQLPQLVGEFDKPNYLRLEPEKCDYQREGVETCRRCFDVCGTWAITKDETRISFNPYLCQGCGDCATACPTGSITFNFPSPQRSLIRIQRMIEAYFDKGGKVPVLLLHDASNGRDWLEAHRSLLPINILPFEIEGLGAAGAEIWLMALAFGAVEVLILDTASISTKTRELLGSETRWVRSILTGLGFGPEVLRMVGIEQIQSTAVRVRPHQPIEPLADWSEDGDKRKWLKEALEHLRKQTSSPPVVLLPSGAPFGAVQVDPATCTLCMKCVTVCPEFTLHGDLARTQLAFSEESCIQCGGCVRICPENAVTLQPRYTFSKDARTRAQTLVER